MLRNTAESPLERNDSVVEINQAESLNPSGTSKKKVKEEAMPQKYVFEGKPGATMKMSPNKTQPVKIGKAVQGQMQTKTSKVDELKKSTVDLWNAKIEKSSTEQELLLKQKSF